MIVFLSSKTPFLFSMFVYVYVCVDVRKQLTVSLSLFTSLRTRTFLL